MDQSETNFLMDRIRSQAQAEGVPLTQEEEMFLQTIMTGHKEEARSTLRNLKEHESMAEFGRRVVGLLMRAYEEDVKSDPQAKEKYMQHREFFAGGPSIFNSVLPLIVGQSQGGHSQRRIPQQDIPPPIVEPKSSIGRFLLLVFLIVMGMVLWMVISKR